ncbi:MAG: hypothetical protein C0624_02315 [Desulfuromonas sp.]|nr:MAG: hypothetical protein C0624_02315 [Desulfuromonas sp.]
MKKYQWLLVPSMVFAQVANVWAVDTTQTYTSGILVLLFVGFCALIVVVQLIPAMLMLYGWVKGLMTAQKLEPKSYHNN